jgi:hypothetical protein
MTLSIDIQHNSIECHYAECRDYLNYMLSVVRLNVIILSVVMLSVVAPLTNEPHKLECLYLVGLSNPD